jgi:ABC-type polysaccharide/polyol phosphate export permease
MTGWYKAVADVNPISHIVEGMRAQVVGGEAGGTLTGLAFALGFAVLAVGISAIAYRRRLATEGA